MHGYYLAPLWLTASLVGCGVLYLGTMIAVSMRLRERHNPIWEALGRPFPPIAGSTPIGVCKLFAFAIFRSQHTTMGDQRLSTLIYVARIAAVVTLFGAILAKAIGHQVYY